MIRSRDGGLQLGPHDEGLELEHDAFVSATWEPGHRYELVAGRLAVTPVPNLRIVRVEDFFVEVLKAYVRDRPDVLAKALHVSRLMTRALGAMTDVQPDVAAYHTFPRDDGGAASWESLSPVLVVEVLSPSHESKDLVRNRQIYGLVRSIQEYWIVDPEQGTRSPSMLALARGADGAWLERPVAPGGIYRTDLLPGLEVDLRRVFSS